MFSCKKLLFKLTLKTAEEKLLTEPTLLIFLSERNLRIELQIILGVDFSLQVRGSPIASKSKKS